MVNQKLLKELREEARRLGVVLALPRYISWADSQSQNEIVYAAAMELELLRREKKMW